MFSDFECLAVKLDYVFEIWREKWMDEKKKREGADEEIGAFFIKNTLLTTCC